MCGEGGSGMKNFMYAALLALLMGGLGWSSILAQAEDTIATLRGSAIKAQPNTPRIPRISNTDLKRMRNYPEQPPTIPHKIRSYQVDKNVNKCLTCHSRRATAKSQAPMVSVTHFMDRDGQVRASISPRRYFCNQCHVPQHDINPLVGNTFLDVDEVIGRLKPMGTGQ